MIVYINNNDSINHGNLISNFGVQEDEETHFLSAERKKEKKGMEESYFFRHDRKPRPS